MKKIFLSLVFFISAFTFGEQFSNTEKKDILKQAAIFQKAVNSIDKESEQKILNKQVPFKIKYQLVVTRRNKRRLCEIIKNKQRDYVEL